MQHSRLSEVEKCYKEYLKKNEVNFCSMATYEIFENISKLSNEDKIKMCHELRDYDDSVGDSNVSEPPRR